MADDASGWEGRQTRKEGRQLCTLFRLSVSISWPGPLCGWSVVSSISGPFDRFERGDTNPNLPALRDVYALFLPVSVWMDGACQLASSKHYPPTGRVAACCLKG